MIAFSGWLALVAAAILGLAIVLAPWLAALIVGLVLVGVGAGLLYFGKSRLDADALAMRRTLGSLREDEAWVREQMSMARGAGTPVGQRDARVCSGDRSEIRRTRAEVGLTLDALAHQVAPRQLIEKGIDMITQPMKDNGIVWDRSRRGGARQSDPARADRRRGCLAARRQSRDGSRRGGRRSRLTRRGHRPHGGRRHEQKRRLDVPGCRSGAQRGSLCP